MVRVRGGKGELVKGLRGRAGEGWGGGEEGLKGRKEVGRVWRKLGRHRKGVYAGSVLSRCLGSISAVRSALSQAYWWRCMRQ
jgi:hypothetical protein